MERIAQEAQAQKGKEIMKRKPHSYWTFEAIHAVAEKCQTRNEFQKTYGAAYMKAYLGGYLDRVTKHMPKRKQNRFIIRTYDALGLQQIARQVTNRSQLQKQSRGAYYAAQRFGVLDTLLPKKPRKGAL